jgi:hypothetical protein
MYHPLTPESAYVTQFSPKRPARSQTAKRVRLTEKSKQEKYSDHLFLLLSFCLILIYRSSDEENPSDSRLNYEDGTLQLDESINELNFSYTAEPKSEDEIIDGVQIVNHSMNNLISDILTEINKVHLPYRKLPSRENEPLITIATNPNFDVPLLQRLLLTSPSPLTNDDRDSMLKIVLHNVVFLLLYDHLFKGENFYGVGSETTHEYLETMFSKLNENRKH